MNTKYFSLIMFLLSSLSFASSDPETCYQKTAILVEEALLKTKYSTFVERGTLTAENIMRYSDLHGPSVREGNVYIARYKHVAHYNEIEHGVRRLINKELNLRPDDQSGRIVGYAARRAIEKAWDEGTLDESCIGVWTKGFFSQQKHLYTGKSL